jgi:hypothetical protein
VQPVTCRNRHCPKCQSAAAQRWLDARQADLLPVEYYHVVLTLPAPIADIAYQNKAAVYGLLFDLAAQVLLTDRRRSEANARSLVNYARRYQGLPISSAMAESALNQLVSSRIAKQQQMRWSDDELRPRAVPIPLRPIKPISDSRYDAHLLQQAA